MSAEGIEAGEIYGDQTLWADLKSGKRVEGGQTWLWCYVVALKINH